MKVLQVGVLAILMGACGNSDKKSTPANDAAGTATESSQALDKLVEESATLNTTEVDATDKVNWAGLDLDGNKTISTADIEQDSSWDLAFKRTAVRIQNPGVTVATIIDSSFDDVTEVPVDAVFKADAPVTGGKETDGLVFHADLGWYSYDIETHIISSRGYVYLVKTTDGAIYKLALNDYYNADRLPAFIQVKSQLLKKAE
jgi:hypothetical protein